MTPDFPQENAMVEQHLLGTEILKKLSNLNSISEGNIFDKQSQNKYSFRCAKARRIYHHQIPTGRILKYINGGKGKIISDTDLHKGNKRIRSGNYFG